MIVYSHPCNWFPKLDNSSHKSGLFLLVFTKFEHNLKHFSSGFFIIFLFFSDHFFNFSLVSGKSLKVELSLLTEEAFLKRWPTKCACGDQATCLLQAVSLVEEIERKRNGKI